VDRTLIVLRHAKSDWSGDQPDLERPLARRGARQGSEAGRWLAEHLDDSIDLALVSPAERTRSTWELVAARFDVPPPALVDDRLYAASSARLLAVLREQPDELGTVLLLGHNPGVEDLVGRLTGAQAEMRTSAIAVIGVGGHWAQTGDAPAELRAAGRPPR
jgi:phosphohistidine phosphatase